ncbi:unnamed protein product [Durusdinium trenchii]|uniref:NAD(+) diphosphatase n=1 Tax=Durusdinium trenchii TaxID=1381693 RepID=A0ABP0QGM9_9DINO
MALAFATFNAQTRVAGNRILDRAWKMPEGWNASLDALNTETRDASGKGSFDTSMILLQPSNSGCLLLAIQRSRAPELWDEDLLNTAPYPRFLVVPRRHGVHSRRILTAGDSLQWLTRQQLAELAPMSVDYIYLGPLEEPLDDLPETDVFVVDLGFLPEAEVATALGANCALISGRELLGSKASDEEVTVAGLALAMVDWHHSAKFEGRSGKATIPVEAGAKRQVEGGSAKVYPRTDPVAIGLIVSPNHQRCLLGRSHKYPTGMYTCLSGFVDLCEPVEEAFKREAFEEAGVRLRSVTLIASQPWPVGRGGSCELMLACKAVAASEHLEVNPKEIEDARWFSRAEVRQMLRHQHPQGLFVPPRFAIANKLISDFAAPVFPIQLGHRGVPVLAGATLAVGIKGIMGLGDKMSKSHLQRFQTFEKLPPKQAVLALTADVGAEDWGEENRKYADKHLRILSGLYGVVRPYDDVKPVRDIPMNAKVKTKKGLYLTEFWGDAITKQLSKDLKSISEGNKGGHILLVKCTSDHYFQSVQAHNLPEGTTVVEIEFEQAPEDVAAKARCQFAKFVIEQKVITPEGLKDFKSQEWSLDERRCTIQKVFYVWIGDDRHRKKKSKKEGKEKDKDRSDASGEDKKKAKRKQKAVEQAQDFSDLSEDVKPKKVKVRVKKKVQAQRERSPDNFSDMNSEEFNARAKKGKKAASDESGSGRKKKEAIASRLEAASRLEDWLEVKRAHDSEERQKRNKEKKRRSSDSS